jgi:hypothetical protein
LVPLLPTFILSWLLTSRTNIKDFLDAKCRCNLVNWESSNFVNWESTSQNTQDMNILIKHIFRDQSKYSRYEYFDQFKIQIFFWTSQNTQDTNILTKHHLIMTQARFAGRGQNSGRAGRGPGNGRGQGRGHGMGYTSKPKTSKVGLCKEL